MKQNKDDGEHELVRKRLRGESDAPFQNEHVGKRRKSSETDFVDPNSKRSKPTPNKVQTQSKIVLFIKVTFVVVGIVTALYFGLDANGKAKTHKAILFISDKIPGLNDWMKSFHQKVPSKSSSSGFKEHNWMAGRSNDPRLKLMTDLDIKYEEGGPLLLVLVGHVFDVSTGFEYYKPGSGYHGFVGQDASRAFVSGEFTKEGLTDDLTELEMQDYKGLAEWLKFYLEHDTYKFVGYHIGRFFDENGVETKDMDEFKKMVIKAEEESEKDGDLKKLFPTCNVEWTREKGTTVWCSNNSGGIERDWIGFPRKFFENPSKDARCACVHANFLADPRVKTYDGCAINSSTCKVLESNK